MTATLIDGKVVAESVKLKVKEGVAYLKSEYNVTPGLATVLVGDRPDSRVYVASKHKACAELGMNSYDNTLPADISQNELLDVVEELARDSKVHGILVQLPLPPQIDAETVLRAIPI